MIWKASNHRQIAARILPTPAREGREDPALRQPIGESF